MSRLDSIRRYHQKRQQDTAIRLMDAIARMRAKNVRWTKKNWAEEAGVNVNTVVAKNPDGTFVFRDANEAFDIFSRSVRSGSVRYYRQRIAELEQQALSQQRVIADLNRRLK